MPTAYDLSSVIGGSSGISHSNLIPLGEQSSASSPAVSLRLEPSPQELTLGTTTNTGIVNHTHSRMGSIMSTGIVPGSAGGQAGSNTATHYPVNQFTMGGPAISMASPMSITTNTMHYGS
ncbi:histone-arginine methyltransferase CARM1 [Bombina bombina]|uniref:histone-arginine methyltransferase CARM1 n=1 Tax=Bombina bombina TaxID=8345 RepID=UPI00235B1F5D|nr:histone-arginine methyltransferase CARM1 [Bombina bombina]